MRLRIPLLGAFFVAAAMLTSCDRSASQAQHETLVGLDPVRNAFNADSGKVRAIFLASPT